MLSCTSYNEITRTASFVVSNDSEIAKLPTTKNRGKDELANVGPVNHGSDCTCIGTSSIYMLDGATDTWKHI